MEAVNVTVACPIGITTNCFLVLHVKYWHF